jgi:hypothetical protein
MSRAQRASLFADHCGPVFGLVYDVRCADLSVCNACAAAYDRAVYVYVDHCKQYARVDERGRGVDPIKRHQPVSLKVPTHARAVCCAAVFRHASGLL